MEEVIAIVDDMSLAPPEKAYLLEKLECLRAPNGKFAYKKLIDNLRIM